MNLKEAKEIVSQIVNWQFVLQGINERENLEIKIDLKKYSLEDLVKANKLVKSNNSRKRKLQEHWIDKKTKSTKGISLQITLDDRLIAGVYTALHYAPNSEMVVLVEDVGIGVVKADYN